MDHKVPLASVELAFQHVNAIEVIYPSFRSSSSHSMSLLLLGNGSYESLHPDIYCPGKILFLDVVEQSTLYGEAAYDKALAHPTMLTQPHSQRVAIISYIHDKGV